STATPMVEDDMANDVEVGQVEERNEEPHKVVTCSLVQSIKEDFFEPLPPLMIWEELETKQELATVDDCNESVEEDPKSLIWGSVNLSSHSHEITALTHGEINEEESTSIGTRSTSVGYEKSTEDALVKLEDMAKDDEIDKTYHLDGLVNTSIVKEQDRKMSTGFDTWIDEDNSEFSVDDDHVLYGVDDFVDDIHSGPATQELSLMGIEDIHSSSFVMSLIYYDMAALHLLIGDFIFIELSWVNSYPT
ncbi:hypothetical protein KI387_020073, partial [Taxus chinensis]